MQLSVSMANIWPTTVASQCNVAYCLASASASSAGLVWPSCVASIIGCHVASLSWLVFNVVMCQYLGWPSAGNGETVNQ